MTSKKLILALLLVCTMPVFAQDADLSMIPYRMGDVWGYANPDKSMVIMPEFEEANLFYEGFAVVKKGGKYGYINKAGKVVIPYKFLSANHFRFGYFEKKGTVKTGQGDLADQKTVLFAGASVQANGYEICIDTKGAVMPQCPAIAESSAPEINKPNTVTVISNYSTIRKTDLYDKIVDDYKMPGAEDSYYIATREGKFGVFNKTFDVIVPFEYSNIEKIYMSVMPYLIVEKDGLKGMMFGNGSLYMAVENTKLKYVQANDGNNYLVFTKNGKSGIKSSKYKMVAEPVYTDIVYDEAGGFILTGENNLKGFVFLNHNIVEPKYAEVSVIKGAEYIRVKTSSVSPKEEGKPMVPGKVGYINSQKVEFFQ